MYIVNQWRTGIWNVSFAIEISVDGGEIVFSTEEKQYSLGRYTDERAAEVFEKMLKECFTTNGGLLENDGVYYMPET